MFMPLLVCIPHWRQRSYLKTNSTRVYSRGDCLSWAVHPSSCHSALPYDQFFLFLQHVWAFLQRNLITTWDTCWINNWEIVWFTDGWTEGVRIKSFPGLSIYFTSHSRGFSVCRLLVLTSYFLSAACCLNVWWVPHVCLNGKGAAKPWIHSGLP